ncbi:MAG TPA: hypothetical protein PL123_00450 [Bacteroidales bacterium]|nr:hypothetical protein [Bacteroidales bacterium]HPT22804.1 hypothetical protein [Bacteroidales bacterium]
MKQRLDSGNGCKSMTLLILFFLFSIQISEQLSAQYSGFDLSRYKLPDIKVSRLDMMFDLGGNMNKARIESWDGDSVRARNNMFGTNINLNYNHFRNTQKYQGILDVRLLGDKTRYSQDNENSNSENAYNTMSLNVTNNSRFYNASRKFIELGPSLTFTRLGEKQKQVQVPGISYDISDKKHSLRLSLPVSAGIGRIEPVEDMRLAIYILEELNKAGRTGSLPDDELLIDLARKISEIKRKRFFDARLRKIEELVELDSFLLASNIISEMDITSFTILNDQWDYASGPSRYAGFSFDAGIDDELFLDRSNELLTANGIESEPVKSNSTVFFIGGFSRIRYEKPHNLYWQSSANLKVRYGMEVHSLPDIQPGNGEQLKYKVFNAAASYAISYIPDSRSLYSLSMEGSYKDSGSNQYFYLPTPGTYSVSDGNIYVKAGLRMYYYVSPQFRISLDSRAALYVINSSKTLENQPELTELRRSSENNLTLTLNYSFF